MEAPVSRSGASPYTLDSRIRTVEPPRLTRTIWRTDWLSKPPDQFGSPKRSGNGAIRALPHPPAHRTGSRRCCVAAAGEAVAVVARSVATAAAGSAR
jgi:hypothetical protein